MTIALFSSVPTAHHPQAQAQLLYYYKYKISSPSSSLPNYPCFSKLTAPLCSPSTSSSVIEEEGGGEEESPWNEIGCKSCGRLELEKGCNGEGRIQGGIATVPGFGWWPIKAYRPCPGFVASGGRYKRQGQSMDEVAFGRTTSSQTPSPSVTATRSKPSCLNTNAVIPKPLFITRVRYLFSLSTSSVECPKSS